MTLNTFGQITYVFSDEVVQNGLKYKIKDSWDGKPICAILMEVTMDKETIVVPSNVTIDVKQYSTTGNNVNVWTFKSTIPVHLSGSYQIFKNCSKVETFCIPKDITSINTALFQGYDLLKQIIVNSENQYLCSEEGILYDKTQTKIIKVPASNPNANSSIKNSISEIGDHAFENCFGLTSINISANITSIGKSAFEGCFALTSIVVENGNPIYDSRDNCNAIIITANNELILGCKTTVIPNSVASIGSSAFYGCTGLTSITIGNNVTCIENDAFNGCNNLDKITINSNTIVSKDRNDKTSLTTIFGKQVKDYILGDEITKIGSYAFFDCTGLTSVTIPNSVTSIGYRAFGNCSGLTSITIPDGVTSIGEYAFEGCSSSLYVNKGTSSMFALWQSGYQPYETGTTNRLLRPYLSYTNTQTSIALTVKNYYPEYTNTINGTAITSADYMVSGLFPGDIHELGLKVSNGTAAYTSTKITVKTNDIYPSVMSWSTAASSVCAKANAKVEGIEGIELVDETIALCYLAGTSTSSSQYTGYYYCDFAYSKNYSDFYNYYFLSEEAEVQSGNTADFCGLTPEKEYYTIYKFIVKNYAGMTKGYSVKSKIQTAALALTTLQPKVISPGNVIVAAESNIDDAETNVGFEWRRTDWTDDFESNKGGAYLFDGMMEGYIRNLNAEKLWKYRPYYTSNSGKSYYGEWVGIDPNNTSYFEPTVHTYAKISVEGNAAEVKGYVMRGSDNVAQQGFKYWKANTATSRREEQRAPSIPKDAMTVEAEGTVMTAELKDLDFETEYYVVAFVKTSENETFYGEQQTFQTGIDTSGVEEVMATPTDATEVSRYDLKGRRLDAPQKGLNIIRMSDGTVRKVMVK